MKLKITIFALTTCALFFTACENEKKETPEAPVKSTPVATTPQISYSVTQRYPHDITSFTEGFLFHKGQLLESTGAPDHLPQTRSAIGLPDLKTGKFELKTELDKNKYFGEGIVVFQNKLYQLTYTNQVGFIYDAASFNQIGQFTYSNKEGWGMTTDSIHLIMSDGTHRLTFLNPQNFSVAKTLEVTKDGYAMDHLNELEYIRGYIYANIWMSNIIVKIDPKTGKVVGQLDLLDLYQESRTRNPGLAEMNGIAYDPASGKVLVTGKLWPDVYEIEFPH